MCVYQWCVKDKGLFAFARKKHKREARQGKQEYFPFLPDTKKDLCLRLRLGEQAVMLGLVPQTGVHLYGSLPDWTLSSVILQI